MAVMLEVRAFNVFIMIAASVIVLLLSEVSPALSNINCGDVCAFSEGIGCVNACNVSGGIRNRACAPSVAVSTVFTASDFNFNHCGFH